MRARRACLCSNAGFAYAWERFHLTLGFGVCDAQLEITPIDTARDCSGSVSGCCGIGAWLHALLPGMGVLLHIGRLEQRRRLVNV